jgi:hypothetical protein
MWLGCFVLCEIVRALEFRLRLPFEVVSWHYSYRHCNKYYNSEINRTLGAIGRIRCNNKRLCCWIAFLDSIRHGRDLAILCFVWLATRWNQSFFRCWNTSIKIRLLNLPPFWNYWHLIDSEIQGAEATVRLPSKFHLEYSLSLTLLINPHPCKLSNGRKIWALKH